MHHSLRCLAGLLALATLAGCTSQAPIVGGYALAPFDTPRSIVPTASMALLPPELASARIANRREVDAGTLREDVIFANDTETPRENRLTLRTRWTGTGIWALLAPGPMLPRYTAASVEARAAHEFPTAREVDAIQERVNPRGPYAYRVAHQSDGSSCVLAWQVVEAGGFSSPADLQGLEFRFCDAKRAPEELLALYDRISLRLLL